MLYSHSLACCISALLATARLSYAFHHPSLMKHRTNTYSKSESEEDDDLVNLRHNHKRLTARDGNDLPITATSTTTTENSENIPTTTVIANHTFRIPTDEHLRTIQERQIFHPLQKSQVFCSSSNLCKHGHPQAMGFHPTMGTKPVSGLFRLTCPLLVQAIDEWEGEAGVREMTDWLRTTNRKETVKDQKRIGYEAANQAQKDIRTELVTKDDDAEKLKLRMGEYNAQRFLESGVAGIPSSQTYNVKCIHAHVADHLCRCSSSSKNNSTNSHGNDGNIIGKHALQILNKQKGLPILGNDVCWQQCNADHERQSNDWFYVPKKNRQKLRSTRLRRKQKAKNDNEDN